MSTTCPATPAADGIATNLVGAIDCFVRGDASANFARFVGAGSTFGIVLTIAMTLYVALIGYRLMFGASGLTLRDWAPRMVLLGGVMAMTTSWSSYQVLVYDLLTDGPAQIAAWANPRAGTQIDAMARVDTLSGRLLDIADAWSRSAQIAEADAAQADISAAANTLDNKSDAATSAARDAVATKVFSPTTIIAPRGGLGPNMLLMSALLLLLASAGVLAVAKVLLALMLMVGPLFIAMALFEATRGLSIGWARAAVLLAIIPLFAQLATVAALAFLEPMVLTMAAEAASDSFSLRTATGILVAVLVMAAVCSQLFRLSRVMTGAWTFLGSRDGGSTMTTDAPSIAATTAVSPLVANERIQTLVADIERQGSTANGSTSNSQRVLIAPVQQPTMAAAMGANAPKIQRSMAGNQPSATRPMLRAVRSGQ